MQNEKKELSEVFKEVLEVLNKYVYFHDPRHAVVCSAWVVHTWWLHQLYTSPRLLVTSATPGCGKTRLGEVLQMLCRNVSMTGNTTASPIMRTLDTANSSGIPATVIIDEFQFSLRRNETGSSNLEEIVKIGYKRGGTSHRADMRDKGFKPQELRVFGAVALLGMNTLPEAVLQRCIEIPMGKAPNSNFAIFEPERLASDAAPIVSKLESLSKIDLASYRDESAKQLSQITNRDHEIWLPIITVLNSLLGATDTTGKRYLHQVLDLLFEIVSGRDLDESDYLNTLLEDVYNFFENNGDDRVSSEDLIRNLNELESQVWVNYDSSGLNILNLPRILRPLRIKPKVIQIGSRKLRGYYKNDFVKAWRLYLNKS
jgi:hypothetical protein